MSVTGSSLEQARLARLASFGFEAMERERERESASAKERERERPQSAEMLSSRDELQHPGNLNLHSTPANVQLPILPSLAQSSSPQLTLVETYISRLTAPRILVADRAEHVKWEKRGLRELVLKEKLTSRVMELEKVVGELVVEIGKAVDVRTALEREVGERKRTWDKMEPILLSFFRLHSDLTSRRAAHIDQMMLAAAQASMDAKHSNASIYSPADTQGKGPRSRARGRVGALMAAGLASSAFGGRSQMGSREFVMGGALGKSHMGLNEGGGLGGGAGYRSSGLGAQRSSLGLNDGMGSSMGVGGQVKEPSANRDQYRAEFRDAQENESPRSMSMSKGLSTADSSSSLKRGMVGKESLPFSLLVDPADEDS
ncbi:hypothetical protein HK097_001363 [Rhizophlyctis rosea]|uniref:Uncharacterized protein n=1 Tax=Rhizophlyctis rosea TaxID=64517 RepID=A0AAD5SHE8_9FUNG|nr:hypothetical protein HK097_001363 [Rhizophlyctis rosea]